MVQIEEFSDSYFVVDAELMPYSGDLVAVANDTYEMMTRLVPLPLLKIHSNHYMVEPEWGIPKDIVAVPKELDVTEETALLAKTRTAAQLAAKSQCVKRPSGEPHGG